ncbi:hypothetical protein EV182_003151 [Spiromyces aspiralis]|uniref:Uncharacterized protein n=1 Tax=Spiromyces aspiralis TaxID=68401 RepID=A0ACC1HH16_9FUNG|nr:hypothetical protein EV182_003151 [Spiromyces aspiralis]
MFLVGCISLQLQLTIVHNKPHVASLANPYYEVVGILVPLLMTHAFTYAFGIQWEPHYFAFTSSNPRGLYLYDWLAIYGWLSALWLYCLVVCVMVIGKLLVLWRKTTRPHMLLLPPGPDQIKPSPGHSSETLLHGSEQWVWPGAPLSARRCSRPSETSSSATTVASVRRKTGNDCQLRRLRFTILRVLLYPLTTVLIGLCPVFLTLVPDSRPLALFFLTFVSCQGTLSFVCFVCNPGTSQFAKIIAARLSGIQGSQ